jgi:5,10-methylenetetrahydromethanopterin reductase
VTNPLARHPVQIARAAATLADLSGGRFVLGLGAGNRSKVLPALRLPADRAALRVAEAIEVCRGLLRGERIDFQGETVSIAGVRLETDPLPEVPIYVGGRGPRVLRAAGAKADGAFIEAMFTPAGMDFALGEIERGAREAGRDLAAVDVVAWQAIRLSTTVAAEDAGRYRTWAALLMRSTSLDVLERLGIDPALSRSVRDAFDAGGEREAGMLVPDDVASRLVLTGDPETVAAQVETTAARGIDRVAIIGFGNTEVVQDTLRRFALDVMARSGR